MASFEQVKSDYDTQAEGYNDITHLPCFIVETELLGVALGDCTGLKVLDFGGGSGLHARQAVDAGAESVDIIDLSTEMLRVADDAEKQLGRVGKVRTFEADATKPIDHLHEKGLHKQYDLVMSNFCFDHATSREQLEDMWRNAISHLKPGGRFVGARVGNMKSKACADGRYGVTYKDFQDIPGGVRYRYIIHLNEPIEFEACSLELSYSGSTEIQEKLGLTNFEEIPFMSSKTVAANPEYWKTFLDDPSMAVLTATKAVTAST
ncbi:S-adenosyl-L-methionine-dependent methyltransferase [Trichoderma compactum]